MFGYRIEVLLRGSTQYKNIPESIQINKHMVQEMGLQCVESLFTLLADVDLTC